MKKEAEQSKPMKEAGRVADIINGDLDGEDLQQILAGLKEDDKNLTPRQKKRKERQVKKAACHAARQLNRKVPVSLGELIDMQVKYRTFRDIMRVLHEIFVVTPASDGTATGIISVKEGSLDEAVAGKDNAEDRSSLLISLFADPDSVEKISDGKGMYKVMSRTDYDTKVKAEKAAKAKKAREAKKKASPATETKKAPAKAKATKSTKTK